MLWKILLLCEQNIHSWMDATFRSIKSSVQFEQIHLVAYMGSRAKKSHCGELPHVHVCQGPMSSWKRRTNVLIDINVWYEYTIFLPTSSVLVDSSESTEEELWKGYRRCRVVCLILFYHFWYNSGTSLKLNYQMKQILLDNHWSLHKHSSCNGSYH